MDGHKSTRLAALDGLRLVAALAVALYHYTVSWRMDGVSPPAFFLPRTVHYSIYGFLGVELFFMISGFVICMSSWGRTQRQFVTSRASRLYPAYWAAVLVTAAVAVAFPVAGGIVELTPISLRTVLVNLTMVQQPLGVANVDGVYWTLFTELRFYLLMWLLLLRGGLTYRKVVVVCWVWLAVAVLGTRIGSPLLDLWAITDYAPYFVAGMALYLIRRFGATPMLYGLVGVTWLVSLHRVTARVRDVHPGFEVPVWPGLLIITAAYAVLLAIALGYADRLTWRWLGTAGVLTYPFYLLHQRIGYTVMRAGHLHTHLAPWLLTAGTVVLLLGAAWLLHRCFEQPGSRLIRRVMRPRQTKPASRRQPSESLPVADTSKACAGSEPRPS